MKTIFVATYALTLGATPAVLGVNPESFMESLNRVMAEAAMDNAEGTIFSVDAAGTHFVLRQADDELVTIGINEKTKYTLDGEKSDRHSALMVGRTAKVAHDKGVASQVDVSTKKGA